MLGLIVLLTILGSLADLARRHEHHLRRETEATQSAPATSSRL